MYDPNVGRWLSEDPDGFGDGPNKLAYVHNSPTNFTDPSGLAASPQGHHIVPQKLWRTASDAVQKFFDSKDARIGNEFYNCHNSRALNGVKHIEYTEVVGKELDKFLAKLKKPISKMTVGEAKQFLQKINSQPADSLIGKFLAGVQKEADDALKAGRAAAKAAAAKAAAKNASKGIKTNCHTGLSPFELIFDILGTEVRAWANDRTFGEQADEDSKQTPWLLPGMLNPDYRPIPGIRGPSA